MIAPHSYRGARGTLELLPGGTVEMECAKRGERVYKPRDLSELLRELRGQPRADLIDVHQVGAMIVERAVAIGAGSSI